MSRQVNRSVAAFLTGLLLAALTATAAAAPSARSSDATLTEKGTSAGSSASLRSPEKTDNLGRKWK